MEMPVPALRFEIARRHAWGIEEYGPSSIIMNISS
jgi:hypothetical protein